MKKIPTIFKRNPNNMKEILDEPNPECLWVFKGEGIATRKYDGTCVKSEKRRYFKRRVVKKDKIAPLNFIEEQFDEVTGKRVGWVPVDPNKKENKYHMEAWDHAPLDPGTYELVGPKIQGNPENYPIHEVVSHEFAQRFPDCPRNYSELKEWLKDKDIEGIVFHHPDGRMGKIKKRDFGLKRK